jgi:hypothetical protein
MKTLALPLLLLAALPGWAGEAPAHPALSADAPRPPLEPKPATPPASQRRIVRIAVTDLELGGVDERAGRIVSDTLVAEMRKLQRASVISFDEVRAMLDLEAEKASMGCDEESSCLAEIADALGADALIVGSVSKVGDEVLVALKRIDQAEARAAQTVTERLPADAPVELLLAIGPAVEKLFPELPLKEGETRGVSEVMTRRMVPPPMPEWAFWGGVAASGVLVAGAAVAGGVQMLAASDVKALGERAQLQIVDGKDVVAAQNRMVAAEVTGWALAATGVAVVSFAGTSALIGLIDFEGYGEE